MRRFHIFLILLTVFNKLHSQVIFNAVSGTDLSIASGTTFSAGGLSFAPSSNFTFNGVQLNRNATVAHPLAQTYVSRVYQFSANTNAFTGTLQFFYGDGELNGIPESNLLAYIHDGSSWSQATTNSNDPTNNYVLTNSISGRMMNEVTLISLASLPLSWGKIKAFRENGWVTIKWETFQEHNVAYFEVEKSTDGISWTTITSHIPALNHVGKQTYSAIDKNDLPAQAHYRIKQVDIDGRSTLSAIVLISALKQQDNISIYPNPVSNSFSVKNSSLIGFASVQLYNNYGALVNAWSTRQTSYNIQHLMPGMYYLLVRMDDGSTRQFKLNKQ